MNKLQVLGEVLSIQSHVVYGHVGNSAAVFPLQRHGIETWPIHTVQFSNHTQYNEKWTGEAFEASLLKNLYKGLCRENKLSNISALITGYQGSAQHCLTCAEIVADLRTRKPSFRYICDPVMGSPVTGCIVADGVQEEMVSCLLPAADIIVPNQFELELFTGKKISNLEEAIEACHLAIEKGPSVILVKHLHGLGDDAFRMLLVGEGNAYLIERPILDFEKSPAGVGDLVTSLLTARLLHGDTLKQALEHVNAAVYGIISATKKNEQWELDLIRAQDELIRPSQWFSAQELEF